MSDNETTQFPKMGESIIGQVVNISGQRSPYTIPEGKKDHQAGPIPGVGDKKNKGRSMVQNAQGPEPTINAKICYPNSGEAGKTQRNVKRVQGPYASELAAAAGNSSFANRIVERGYEHGV